MSAAKKYSTYVGGRILAAALGLVAIVGYSHLLSPEVYGEYAGYFALASLANMSLFQWIRVSLTRHVAADQPNAPQLLGFSMLLQAAIYLAACLAIPVAALLGHFEAALLVVAMLGSMALSDFTLEAMRANHDARGYSTQYLLRQILIMGLALGLAWFRLVPNPIIFGFIVGNTLPSLLTLVGILRRARLGVVRADARGYLRYGLPLIFNYSVSGFLNSCDRLLVIALLGRELGGVYAFAADFARQLVMTLMESINLAAFPDAVRALHNDGFEAAKRVLENNFFMLFGIAAPAALGLAITAPPLSAMLFGADFAPETAMLIPIFAAATFCRGARVFYFDQAFQLSKKTELTAVSTTLSAILLVALTLALTPPYGLPGAAWGAFAAAALSLLFSRAIGGRALNMPVPLDILAAIAIGCALVALVGYPLVAYLPGLTGLAAAIVASILVYALAIVLLQRPRMRQLWRSVRHGR